MRKLLLILAVVLTSGPALAQGANIAFGGMRHDTTQPVEVASDSLTVDQTDGAAVFDGNVLITQGEMKISADHVRVEYAQNTEQTRISRLIASGGVTLVNGAEAAEAAEAVYSIDAGTVVLSGDVILTQGQNALSGNKLTVNLNTGSGRMDGRVRTVFQASGN